MRYGLFVVCATMAISIVAGCEETVNPIIGSERPFTIWGYMDSGADTQYVRVFRIANSLGFDESTAIDASVASTDLTTGERVVWNHKTVYFDSVKTGHVFWSPFRAGYEHRYRLEVVRSDGAMSSAEASVPPKVDFQIEVEDGGLFVPIRISGNIPNLVGPRVIYHAMNLPPMEAWPPGTNVHPPVLHSVAVPYGERLKRTNNGWLLTVNMLEDTSAVRDDFEANCLVTSPQYSAPDIWLRSMEFSVLAADSAWQPPGGILDPNFLAAPGTFSNVKNGYGYFGAGESIRIHWAPTEEARLSAGYTYDVRCMRAFDADACRNPPVPCSRSEATDIW